MIVRLRGCGHRLNFDLHRFYSGLFANFVLML
jgi:hypothetical protein